jgi:replicative DNA helicase
MKPSLNPAAAPRSLPHDPDAEKALLCSIALQPAILDELQGVEPCLFYLPDHQAAFKGMRQVYLKTGNLDFTLLCSHLSSEGALEEAGGMEGLDAIWALHGSPFVPTSANWRHYFDRLQEMHQRRCGIRRLADLQAAYYDVGSNRLEETIRCTESLLSELSAQALPESKSWKDILMEVYDDLSLPPESEIPGITFGIPLLDQSLWGIGRDENCLLCAPTGRGKSALAMQAAKITALKGGKVAVFSLEMSPKHMAKRMFAHHAKVSMRAIKTRQWSNGDLFKLEVAIGELVKAKFFFEEGYRMQMAQVVTRCRQLHARHQLDLIVIDYLQLLGKSMEGKNDASREEMFAACSREVRLLTLELGVPIIAVAQLNSAGGVFGSSAPPKDNAKVIRITDQLEVEGEPDACDIVIDKDRDGERAVIPVNFRGQYLTFEPRQVRPPAPVTPPPAHNGNGNRNGGRNGARHAHAY